MPTTAHLEPQYAARAGAPRLPAMEAVFTMAASFEARRLGAAARVMRKTPMTLTSKILSQRASEKVSRDPLSTTPALLTNTSRRPKASTVAATAASQDSAFVTSKGVARTSPKGDSSSTARAISERRGEFVGPIGACVPVRREREVRNHHRVPGFQKALRDAPDRCRARRR